MFCKKCGDEYIESDKFCGKCGAKLYEVSITKESEPVSKSGYNSQSISIEDNNFHKSNLSPVLLKNRWFLSE